MGILQKAIKQPKSVTSVLKNKLIEAWIPVHNTLFPSKKTALALPSDLREFEEIRQRAQTPTDISDHLITLFMEALRMQPRLIVELGVRSGESTFVFERVARLCQAQLVSVDIDDCSGVGADPGWLFVQSDDIVFAGQFQAFCASRGLPTEIDVLFIDTSHLYEHTVEEVKHWIPLLARRALVFLHDTNLNEVGRRRDGSLFRGMNSKRAVISAVEQYLRTSLPETQDFLKITGSWLIKHYSHCNGLTILEKLEVLPENTTSSSAESLRSV